jgi:cytochrome b pre-mRNA-processing protein 3
MLQRLFVGRPAITAGRRLYVEAVSQARDPAFYGRYGVADTADGRFEMYSLHVILLLHRLKDQGEAAAETAQGLYDAYVKSLDDAMREAGVGDLSVGKKVRRLGEAFFGRVKAYDAALAALPERTELDAAVARIVYGDTPERVPPLADYVAEAVGVLRARPLEGLLEGRAAWPEMSR